MKNILTAATLLISAALFCQTWEMQYNFAVKNSRSDQVFNFPAVLQMNNKNQKLYSVNFGISDQVKGDSKNGIAILIDKGKYTYLFYSDGPDLHFSSDEIKGKRYLFKDSFSPLEYKISKETKMAEGLELTKAETTFRGRNYMIWFDAKAKAKGGPWKFTGLPGIAYEIYDDENLFRWTLIAITKVDAPLAIPFSESDLKNTAISYEQYPDLKYSSPVFMKDEEKNSKGNYQAFKQERNGLEKTFEWEK